MIEQKLLDRLRTLQQDTAIGLAEIPQVDYPKYMRQVGMYQGLGQAINELEILLRDTDE